MKQELRRVSWTQKISGALAKEQSSWNNVSYERICDFYLFLSYSRTTVFHSKAKGYWYCLELRSPLSCFPRKSWEPLLKAPSLFTISSTPSFRPCSSLVTWWELCSSLKTSAHMSALTGVLVKLSRRLVGDRCVHFKFLLAVWGGSLIPYMMS